MASTLRAVSDLGNCYEILGLDRGASSEEVKQAWRDMVQVWHPDRFTQNPRLRQKAQEKLKEVNEAYEALRGLRQASGRPPKRSPGTRAAQWEWAGSADEADHDPLVLLRKGVHAWNLWRRKYSDLAPSLSGADLKKADLAGYDLRDLDLSQAKLQKADLYKADLSGALLKNARLTGADLSRATLVETNLSGAEATEADLSSADLSGSRLSETILSGANLVGTILYGVDVRRAVGLTREQIDSALTDSRTRLPLDF